eukprot:3847798-Rhodomonas_salina.1
MIVPQPSSAQPCSRAWGLGLRSSLGPRSKGPGSRALQPESRLRVQGLGSRSSGLARVCYLGSRSCLGSRSKGRGSRV